MSSSKNTFRLFRDALRPREAPAEPWSALDLAHTLKSGVEVRVCSQSDWWVYNEVFVDGVYDEAIDVLLSRVDAAALPTRASKTRPLVVDLGANVGFFAARVIDVVASSEVVSGVDLVLIEGSPTVYDELSRRLSGLQSDFADIRVEHALAGERGGSATIAEVAFGARNTLRPEHNSGIKPVGEMQTHEVRFVDLDVLIGWDTRVSLLKCDIEGSEGLLIESYHDTLLPRTDAAVFEFHHELCDVSRCIDLLTGAGLDVVSSADQHDGTSLVLLSRSGTVPSD